LDYFFFLLEHQNLKLTIFSIIACARVTSECVTIRTFSNKSRHFASGASFNGEDAISVTIYQAISVLGGYMTRNFEEILIEVVSF